MKQQVEKTKFEPLINYLALKIKKKEITTAQVEFAIGEAIDEMKAESFKDVYDYYKASIMLGKTTIDEVEEQLCGKKR